MEELTIPEILEPLRRVRAVEQILGVRYNDPRLLLTALTHSSARSFEYPPIEFQRLECVGDGVLNLAVVLEAYKRNLLATEYALTRSKGTLASNNFLARRAAELGLQPFIYHKCDDTTDEARRGFYRNLLADTFEAILGALYFDQGFEVCRDLVARLIVHAAPTQAPILKRAQAAVAPKPPPPPYGTRRKTVFPPSAPPKFERPVVTQPDPVLLLKEYVDKTWELTVLYSIVSDPKSAGTGVYTVNCLVFSTVIGTGEGATFEIARSVAAAKAWIVKEKWSETITEKST